MTVSHLPMPDYDRVKHLEMIGKAIERMDKGSSSLKALSPAALGIALLLVDKRIPAWLALGAAAFAVLVYWYQDARFLGRERSFRSLYDEVRVGKRDDDPYVMDIARTTDKKPIWRCLMAGPVIGVHGVALVTISIAFWFLSL